MNKRTHISLFHTNPETRETKELKFSLDKINKLTVDINLTVCSSDTIRGKNKTDHAYRNQNVISLSGSFSERTVDQINKDFFRYGKNKLKNIQELFLSFLNDGRLFYIYSRFKTYKNYVLKSCSFSYSNSVSGMEVDFVFVEVMLRNNPNLYSNILVEEFNNEITYFPPLADAVMETPILALPVEEVQEISLETNIPAMEDVIIPVVNIKGDPNIVKTYNNVVMNVYDKGIRQPSDFSLGRLM